MGPQLSPQAQVLVEPCKALPLEEQRKVAEPVSANVAAAIAQQAATATPEKRAKASLHIDEAVKTATHGFKQVTARDGRAAIEVKITRPKREKVTILISDGARGKLYGELADYGRNELEGATLLSHDDFKAVVKSLYRAIKDLKVVKGFLQTEDEALKQAYQIVTEGVRRDGGFSLAVFDVDGRGAVVGWHVSGGDNWNNDHRRGRFDCAAFVSLPAESK